MNLHLLVPGTLCTFTHRRLRGDLGPSRLTNPLREGPDTPDVRPRASLVGDPKCEARLIFLDRRREVAGRGGCDQVHSFYCPRCAALIELRRDRLYEWPWILACISKRAIRMWNQNAEGTT